jgi:hypothetical protein
MRDKVAAAALLVAEDAATNVRALDELLTLAGKAGGARDVAGHAIDALKELFGGSVLPDRRLVEFGGRPLAGVKPSKENDRRLLLWWAEDCLKKRRAPSAPLRALRCAGLWSVCHCASRASHRARERSTNRMWARLDEMNTFTHYTQVSAALAAVRTLNSASLRGRAVFALHPSCA